MPTMKIPEKIWERAEKTAVDATLLRRTPVNISEVIRYVLENYLEDGMRDFIEQEKAKK
ncbi:hypothetical protein [Shewanella chilikensis]|uniref:Uncharacterized protein n=1 Tax=Shewanella chilikensis TaxID=558541 RepID=A0A6G7LS97_9GAMM|nr:hypothetical protein [Shewanella chilikensis]QIJ04687.1 hypothetical protein GII14_11365 [Shewanella chilikensis]QIJ04693.1 hypothetical protein GII14_11395 [Shewanella chilikensis]QIJ04699.1 hypothetical protein GII14_11425 [Shewanella chilikensis]